MLLLSLLFLPVNTTVRTISGESYLSIFHEQELKTKNKQNKNKQSKNKQNRKKVRILFPFNFFFHGFADLMSTCAISKTRREAEGWMN